MAFEDDRPLTQIEYVYLDRIPLPPNDLSPAPDIATTLPIPHPTLTFQKDAAANRNRNRRDADVDGEGTTTASAKEVHVAPRRPGGRQDSARPKPPAKEAGKLARKRRILDVDGTQSGPTAKNRDGSLQL